MSPRHACRMTCGSVTVCRASQLADEADVAAALEESKMGRMIACR